MPSRDRQTVGVQLTLTGTQDTATVAHHRGTDAAAISVRIGRALIYLHDPGVLDRIDDSWRRLISNSFRLPARAPDTDEVPGMREPSVLVNAVRSLPIAAHIVRAPGQPSLLHLQIGRLGLDIRDQVALHSTHAAFLHARLLAPETFPAAAEPPPSSDLTADAFTAVSRALGTLRPRRALPPGSPRTGRAWPPNRIPQPTMHPSERRRE